MLNTDDLYNQREELKQTIVDDFNSKFNTELEFDELEEYLEQINISDRTIFEQYWSEYAEIEAIDALEKDMGQDFDNNTTLISDDEFFDYVIELVNEVTTIPNWVVIDWNETVSSVKHDYTAVEYNDETYYYR